MKILEKVTKPSASFSLGSDSFPRKRYLTSTFSFLCSLRTDLTEPFKFVWTGLPVRCLRKGFSYMLVIAGQILAFNFFYLHRPNTHAYTSMYTCVCTHTHIFTHPVSPLKEGQIQGLLVDRVKGLY